MVRKSVFSLVSSNQKVENDIRTQRCVLVMVGVGVGGNGGGRSGSVAREIACSDEWSVHTIKIFLLFDGKHVHQSK